MKTLVTGAGGQLGEALLNALAKTGHQVFASDVIDPPGNTAATEWSHLDVTDAAQVQSHIERIKPDRVFHLAAILSAKGEGSPERAYQVNQNGTHNLLEACRTHRVSQLVFTSSIAVYGPNTPSPAPEATELLPTTLYGATKAAGEMLGNYYHKVHGLDFRGVRFPGIIGATPPGGGTTDFALEMFFHAVDEAPYVAFCRPNTRVPFMFMTDAIRSLVELSDTPRNKLSRCTYNVAAISPTAEAIADAIRKRLPSASIKFNVDPPRQAILDSWPHSLDDSRARADWGWRHQFDLDRITNTLIDLLQTSAKVS